jgi:hypothetical protein
MNQQRGATKPPEAVDIAKIKRRKMMFRNLKISHTLLIVLAIAIVTAVGCQKKGEEVPLNMPEETTQQAPMPVVPSRIVVPEDVAAKWNAVVLEVTDKDTNERRNYTMTIGETAPLGDTGLNVYVEAFLPSFQMAGDVFTSSSPDLNNPAAKVTITDESGNELYNRWLFALYPATHPFDHPRYAVVLTDQVAKE